MAKPRKSKGSNKPPPHGVRKARLVDSLLDSMIDRREYTSIVDAAPRDPASLMTDARRAIKALQSVRDRPCVCYVANPIKPIPHTGIEGADFLPFMEMLNTVPTDQTSVDVFLASPGGSAETVGKIVEGLRRRFDQVEVIVPADAMSAGTLFSLAGDDIWMSPNAYLGPIDPQVPSRDGRFVPAQALLTLLAKIQADGEARLKSGHQPDWSHVVLLKNLDQKELGHAISASEYSINMATEFLATYKFRRWTKTDSGREVTGEYRRKRAREIAEALCSHERWRAHGHRINRAVLYDEIRLKISHPEHEEGFDRAIRRLWAMWYYIFDKANVAKVMMSEDYTFARNVAG